MKQWKNKREILNDKVVDFCKKYGKRYKLSSDEVRTMLSKRMAVDISRPGISDKDIKELAEAFEQALHDLAWAYDEKNLGDTTIRRMFAQDVTEVVLKFYQNKKS